MWIARGRYESRDGHGRRLLHGHYRKRASLHAAGLAAGPSCHLPRHSALQPLDGVRAARSIVLRVGAISPDRAPWSLRRSAWRVVEVGIVDSIRHQVVHQQNGLHGGALPTAGADAYAAAPEVAERSAHSHLGLLSRLFPLCQPHVQIHVQRCESQHPRSPTHYWPERLGLPQQQHAHSVDTPRNPKNLRGHSNRHGTSEHSSTSASISSSTSLVAHLATEAMVAPQVAPLAGVFTLAHAPAAASNSTQQSVTSLVSIFEVSLVWQTCRSWAGPFEGIMGPSGVFM